MLPIDAAALKTVRIHGEGDIDLRVVPTETLALIDASAVVGDFQIGLGQFPR
ncbi:hypothetical protein CHELA1G11_21700 [Hyphomicrobiales bacterium]|nr:hypothetical protein CHELA1G11_21700 [Hyphomicrobiales bacterium]CAH1695497.1 hypothetical protein CHELA1G2_22005 [Hyphomicrobiales bacterium]